MIQLNTAQAAFVRKLLGKLTERSTIAGALTLVLGIVGINKPDLAAQIAGVVASIASIALVLINDQAFGALFAGRTPAPTAPVMDPQPTNIPVPEPEPQPAVITATTEVAHMSLLSSVAGALLHINPIVSAAVQAVTLVEALFPDSDGAAKLQAAQAYVAKAAGTAEDVTGTIEGVLAALKAQGVISTSSVAGAPG
ncbi:MAG: hypothetical protein ABW154_14155 [Dyella sp.]